MLIDQMVFAPFFCGMFIFGVGFLEHPNDIMRAVSSVSEKIIPTMTVNYFIWPAVLLINFSFVPKTWRLLFLNSVGFFWIILLTYITHRTNGKTPHMEPVESITNRAYAFIKIWLEMY